MRPRNRACTASRVAATPGRAPRRRSPCARPTTWRRFRARGAHVRQHRPILVCQLPTARFGLWGGIRLRRRASWRVVAQDPVNLCRIGSADGSRTRLTTATFRDRQSHGSARVGGHPAHNGTRSPLKPLGGVVPGDRAVSRLWRLMVFARSPVPGSSPRAIGGALGGNWGYPRC